jgi:hypothetical protein
MSKGTCRRIIWALVACALPGGLLAAQSDKGLRSFPDYAEVEFEHSIITIPIILNGETEPAEVLKLDAYMKLDRERPVRNGLGYRQFEFTIDAWELHGYSKVLDAYVTFKLSDTVKPRSLGVSLQKDRDYPAMIVYNAIYDIYLDDVKVAENRAGVAFATGVMEIPPRNITVAFHKPFAFDSAGPGRSGLGRNGNARSPREKSGAATRNDLKCQVDPCPCFEIWCMGDGTCEDMEQIPQAVFEAGAAKAKSYRTKREARLKEGGAAAPGAPAAPRKKPN